ncbi:MAG TPA: ThiF family adenylyltransferase [Streptomyces sp.]|uniref:ThiF family adenylyltransferase n=1 Tax=Streptomyces sp. TaxID=1931 RepID=UPI002C6AA10A|nr:ThiF family adenylyltransferase [Streptomyces sp.]HWU08651.1 ThiF family adenylyltransferase [Streptomyces sp.]
MTPENMGLPPAGSGESGPHSVFYEELITRNAGVISAEEQLALRNATILVAGCGSIGGAAVEPLTRLGAQRFLVADPGTYELNNLNRQSAVAADIEQNKAAAAAERIMSINPHARVTVFTEGVTGATVQRLTAPSQIIIDGVDVTTADGWHAKHLLHRVAVQRKLPLITGWDMAGTQYVRCYDYRRIREPFAGAISLAHIERMDTWDLLRRAVPLRRVPAEMLAEIRANHLRADYSFPQVAYTATAFGVLSSHMAVRILAGKRVRQEISVDVHQMARPLGERWLNRLRRPFELAALVPPMLRLMRSPGAR